MGHDYIDNSLDDIKHNGMVEQYQGKIKCPTLLPFLLFQLYLNLLFSGPLIDH